MALRSNKINTQKNQMLTEKTDRAWFSRLLRHLATRQSGSILTTLEPARLYEQLWETPTGFVEKVTKKRKYRVHSCRMQLNCVLKWTTVLAVDVDITLLDRSRSAWSACRSTEHTESPQICPFDLHCCSLGLDRSSDYWWSTSPDTQRSVLTICDQFDRGFYKLCLDKVSVA